MKALMKSKACVILNKLNCKHLREVNKVEEQKIDNWISIDDVATYLGVTKDTIRNWIKKTDIPAHKIGKLWKFKRSELDEWVKSGKSAIE